MREQRRGCACNWNEKEACPALDSLPSFSPIPSLFLPPTSSLLPPSLPSQLDAAEAGVRFAIPAPDAA
eukprot:3077347-Rhodomonas_salina.4